MWQRAVGVAAVALRIRPYRSTILGEPRLDRSRGRMAEPYLPIGRGGGPTAPEVAAAGCIGVASRAGRTHIGNPGQPQQYRPRTAARAAWRVWLLPRGGMHP